MHFMGVVYEHFEYKRKLPIFLRLVWSLPDNVFYIHVPVKVAKKVEGISYCGSLTSSSMDYHCC